MKDRVPVNPGRVLVTPENGGAAYYATLTRADNPTQEGTPLNKAALLKDATAALFGLGGDAVPDDVLNAIKTLINGANANADAKAQIATGSYTGTGTYGASNPNSLTFDFEPKLVIVHGGLYYLVAVYSQGRATAVYLSVSKTCWLTWDENALSWQGENAEYQLNLSNVVYNYIAIG